MEENTRKRRHLVAQEGQVPAVIAGDHIGQVDAPGHQTTANRLGRLESRQRRHRLGTHEAVVHDRVVLQAAAQVLAGVARRPKRIERMRLVPRMDRTMGGIGQADFKKAILLVEKRARVRNKDAHAIAAGSGGVAQALLKLVHKKPATYTRNHRGIDLHNIKRDSLARGEQMLWVCKPAASQHKDIGHTVPKSRGKRGFRRKHGIETAIVLEHGFKAVLARIRRGLKHTAGPEHAHGVFWMRRSDARPIARHRVARFFIVHLKHAGARRVHQGAAAMRSQGMRVENARERGGGRNGSERQRGNARCNP